MRYEKEGGDPASKYIGLPLKLRLLLAFRLLFSPSRASGTLLLSLCAGTDFASLRTTDAGLQHARVFLEPIKVRAYPLDLNAGALSHSLGAFSNHLLQEKHSWITYADR